MLKSLPFNVLVLTVGIIIGVLATRLYKGSYDEEFRSSNIKAQYSVMGTNNEYTKDVTSETIKMFFNTVSGNLATAEVERMILLQETIRDFARRMLEDIKPSERGKHDKNKLPA